MKAVWLEDGKLEIRDDLPIPKPPSGEALVRVKLAGICNTDLELVKGYSSFTGIPGHEFVGEALECPGKPELEGQRVVGSINAVCHKCDMCRRGLEGHCRNRTVLGITGRDGVFAEYTLLPTENLYLVPDSLSDREAVFVEPLAAALQVLELLELDREARIAVTGAGKLGQLISEALAAEGFHPVAVPRYPWQWERLEGLGVSCRPWEEMGKGSFDVVVESTGSPSGLKLSLELLRPRGTMVLKSTYQGIAELDLSRIVVDEITILGSRCGPFPRALEMLAVGKVSPGSMVEDTLPLSEGLEAFAKASARGAGKILLLVSE